MPMISRSGNAFCNCPRAISSFGELTNKLQEKGGYNFDETKTQEWNAYNAGCKILENSGNSRFEWHSEEGKKDPLYLEWIDKHGK